MTSDPTQDTPPPSEGTTDRSGIRASEPGPAPYLGHAGDPARPTSSDERPAATLETSAVQPSPVTLEFALLRGALEEIPFGVATTREGKIRYANEALARMLGAPHGKLEQKPIEALFDPETWRRISAGLGASRSFDGRVRARCEGGRQIDVELHVEHYSSEAQGAGGFLILRDVTLELGALGRLVDQLGGALFRLRVSDGRFEWVSPAIAKLTGLDASVCTMHPVLLTQLVSDEERERLFFLYRRMAKGELLVSTAQVSVRRPDGTTRVVHIRATGRRDTSGRVAHIDGVVVDAPRDPDASAAGAAPISVRGARPEAAAAGEAASPIAGGTMELSHELLREASQHLHAIGRELRALRAIVRGAPPDAALQKEVLAELSAHVDALHVEAAATAALNRGVRRALASETMGAPLVELLENVRATLGPVVGAKSIAVDAGDGGDMVVQERVQELTLALTHLGLRAFRFAGSGSLRITARRAAAPAASAAPRALGARPPPAGADVLVEIVGTAPSDLAENAMEISSDMVRTIPRPTDVDLAYASAQTLIAAAGGAIELDDAGFTTARTTVRLRGT